MTLITRRQALGAAALSLSLPSHAQEGEPVGMQLILAADVSGSVNMARYKIQQDGYTSALLDPRVLATIRNLDPPVLGVTFIAWSYSQAVMVPWTRVHDASSMEAFCTRLKHERRPEIGIYTCIREALLYCSSRFDTNFSGGRKVIDVSGDGQDSYGISGLVTARQVVLASGVTINGLPIIVKPPEYIYPPQPPEGLEVYYRNYVVGGPGHVVIESRGFENFQQAILQKLLLEIA